jgi:hypothetical protein
MNPEKFLSAYNESRNGTDQFYQHWFVRSFAYSSGVRECMNEGISWLVDIAATELPKVIRKSGENLVTLCVRVVDSKALLYATVSGDAPLPWKKKVGWTDMPDGDYNFLIADEGGQFRMILVSEY